MQQLICQEKYNERFLRIQFFKAKRERTLTQFIKSHIFLYKNLKAFEEMLKNRNFQNVEKPLLNLRSEPIDAYGLVFLRKGHSDFRFYPALFTKHMFYLGG